MVKAVLFCSQENAEHDARWQSSMYGKATLTRCGCFARPAFYVTIKPWKPTKRHDPGKHQVIGEWRKGRRRKT